jgi:hypothetical protein
MLQIGFKHEVAVSTVALLGLGAYVTGFL